MTDNVNTKAPIATNGANIAIPAIANANSIAPLSANILSYPGGPNAPLGIGKTNIRFADQRTGINNANGKGMVEGTYQTTRSSGRTANNIISPLTKGASGKYLDYTGGNLFNNPSVYNGTVVLFNIHPELPLFL